MKDAQYRRTRELNTVERAVEGLFSYLSTTMSSI